jgi:HD-GYP domain-containing protein (c-di-GMP phosphodiesterase class II)
MANAGSTQTALDPTFEHAVGELRARRTRGPVRSEQLAAHVLGAVFLAAAVVTAVVFDPAGRDPDAAVLMVAVAAYSLAFRLEFEVGTGLAVPTQVVVVPLLFVAPVAQVPLLVAGGILLANLVDFLRGTLPLGRVALGLGSGWYVLGPVLVLGLAGSPSPSLSDLPLYVLALAGQFGADLASSAVYERLTSGVHLAQQLAAMKFVWLVDAALASVGLAVAFPAAEDPYGLLLAVPPIVLLSAFARERKLHIDHALELSAAYRGTAFLLGDVVEADDAYTGSHSREVVDLAVAVADELGFGARERRDAEFVALLHDVGKVRIPKEIINKPGPLTDEERAIMNMHTIEGERMLEKVGGLLGEVGALVRSCHERWDGEGYPDGLAGEEIPLIARIVSCCDAFNAMTTDRPYRMAMPLDDALAELERNAGGQFDPAVVAALVAVVSRAAVSA